jgi:hypothetical protein
MVDQWSFRGVMYGVQKCLHHAWLETSRVRERIPEGAHKGAELRELLRTGRFMHTVQGWYTEPGKVRGDGAISQ